MLTEVDIHGAGDPGRGECSLCVLTNQFLKYMAGSGENTVDLKQAAVDLQVIISRALSVPCCHASERACMPCCRGYQRNGAPALLRPHFDARRDLTGHLGVSCELELVRARECAVATRQNTGCRFERQRTAARA
jgi:hypothetical protein